MAGCLAALLLPATVWGCGGSSSGGAEEPSGESPPAPAFTRRLVLTGDEGLTAEVAEFADNRAYVKISGLRNPAAHFVFLTTVEEAVDGSLAYRTQWDGDDFVPVRRAVSRGGRGDATWTLYAPELPRGLPLTFDEDRSATLNGNTLHEEHHRQRLDGSLAAVQEFDREAALEHQHEVIQRALDRTQESCGSVPEWRFPWDQIGDEVLSEFSVAGYCGNILGALRRLCRYEPAMEFIQERMHTIECGWSDTFSMRLNDGVATFSVGDDMPNLADRVREALLAEVWTDGMTLGDAVTYAQTDVCVSANQAHLVAVHPHQPDRLSGISYGTAERLYHSPQPPGLTRGWFFDPRHVTGTNNRRFRGRDLRHYGRMEVNLEERTCELTCGERTTSWSLMPTGEARTLLRNVEIVPAPFDREPYALARDRRGIYYYVDRGASPETVMDFHIYRGRRGSMEQLDMRDVASDSRGEVFSTSRGELRLVVDEDEGAQWIEGRRIENLRQVPVEENYRLIMIELGVYLAQRFELPCDDY